MKKLLYILLLVFCLPNDSELTHLKAFHGLEGEGADEITGGRGGVKFFITSLSSANIATLNSGVGGEPDYYTGTWTGAMNLSQPAQIIPRVSGNCDGCNVNIDGVGGTSAQDHKTYHGHLAPEGGFALINSIIDIANAQDFVFRYLTVRDGVGANLAVDDVLFFNRTSNMVLDHVSAAWGGDEITDMFPGTAAGVTYENHIIQRCLFAQARDNHNRGGLWGSVNSTSGDVIADFHLNLWSNSFARFPNATGTSATQIRSYNDIYYNWVGRTNNVLRAATVDMAYSYFVSGPNTIPLDVSMMHQYQDIGGGPPSIFSEGNYVPGYLTDLQADNTIAGGVWSEFDNNNSNLLPSSYFRSTMLPIDPNVGYTPMTALEAYQTVVVDREVGNNRATNSSGETVLYHDSIDTYYLDDVTNKNGTLSESQFVHPARASNTPFPDTDFNGIDDNFEAQHGITLASDVIANWVFDGRTITNSAGYDAFEMWSMYKAGDFDTASSSAPASKLILNRRRNN